MTARTAVAHWAQSINGGGERVAWDLARTFDTGLWVGAKGFDGGPDDVPVRPLFDGVTARLLERNSIGAMVVGQFAWETPDPLRAADVVVTSGNECLAYVPRPEQTWVHYVHHTSRQATDRLPSEGLLKRVPRKAERQVYARYAQKPDVLVANSDPVRRRIGQYWGRTDDVRVVYPPVPVAEYGPGLQSTGDYHLALQRLDGHKRLAEVVDAYRHLDVTLKVAGDGPERDSLEEQAAGADNIEFLGYVSEQRKRDLLAGAAAKVVNAHREDFGLTTVEALASGTPVIGVKEGMTQYLVEDGVTGVTYERGELHAAARRFENEGVRATPAEIAATADRFGADRFRQRMRDIVDAAVTQVARTHAPTAARPEQSATATLPDGGEDTDAR